MASSSASSRNWVYDVFPSFSGEDVRKRFLSHFLRELDRKLIIAFKDKKIEKSESLDPVLRQAIKDSRIAIVVFSKNYASSSWCLNELLEIVKCKEEFGQIVIPLFYDLDPCHVRYQVGEFGEVFNKICWRKTEDEIQLYRKALTHVANLVGYHSDKWHNEAKMIEAIASDVLGKLNVTPSKDFEDFVGMEDHIAKMSELLRLESEEVRMVGIWGPSGIGKTTIARALYGRLCPRFQGSVFIDRAFVSKSMELYSRGYSDDYSMKLHLQGNFLSKILGKNDIKIDHLGAVRDRLKHEKVLIVIDDLDDQVVLDALAGQNQWFGSGSRILVVTNDKRLLMAHAIDNIYEVVLPSEKCALEMLCLSAFRQNSPPEGFKMLAVEVARYAGSLPLGLSVLGSYLRGRNKEYWMDMLPRLWNSLDGKIEKTLSVSYDGLCSEKDKAIFRHIACLFSGEEITYIKWLLANSNLDVNIGLQNLVEKSLIHVGRWGEVQMHRLLQETGRKVVRMQSLDEPGKREFLVEWKDIYDVLNENTGTKKVLGISLRLDEIGELLVHENAFKGMPNLRFLMMYSFDILRGEKVKLQLPESFDYLPSNLKLLHWDGYPMRCMPCKFRPENLVELKMKNSKLEKLWEGVVPLTCLKKMDLSQSKDLKEFPDLSMATNLETLDADDCSSLVELPPCIRNLHRLTELSMARCTNLEILPTGINLKSLEYLDLDRCSRLRIFPVISTNIASLILDRTSIEELPSKLRLKNLNCLRMKRINKLWEGVQSLTHLMDMLPPSLTQLYLSDIPSLVELPSSFRHLSKLECLSITNCTNLETFPTDINLESLNELDLSGCSRLKSFPDISTNISILILYRTGIEEVPWWIEKFSRLQYLNMGYCSELKFVSLNISKLKRLTDVVFLGCEALNGVVLSGSESDQRSMEANTRFSFINCFNLDLDALLKQHSVFFKQFILSGEEVPSYFTHQTTGTSSLAIPLLQRPFRFRTCVVLDYSESMFFPSAAFPISVNWRFKGTPGNQSDSADHLHSFTTYFMGGHLMISDYCFPLPQLNYDHVDIQLHMSCDNSRIKVKGWGIRLVGSSSENRLGHPHVCEATMFKDGCHVSEQEEECLGSNVEAERSRKRMRIT